MQKMHPCLWFDTQAEEAARFYVSVFQDSHLDDITRYGDAGPLSAGTVLSVSFRLGGQEFMALNGGPAFTFTPAVSFFVHCESQAEVDAYWDALAAGGEEMQCGWVKDRYGVAWQIVPDELGRLMSDPDPVKARRVTEAMLKMVKLDVNALRAAYEQA
jgi:predicted 3-demethylubiquinone-9 3-methyltransferase (glyoxalase superfamily)